MKIHEISTHSMRPVGEVGKRPWFWIPPVLITHSKTQVCVCVLCVSFSRIQSKRRFPLEVLFPVSFAVDSSVVGLIKTDSGKSPNSLT